MILVYNSIPFSGGIISMVMLILQVKEVKSQHYQISTWTILSCSEVVLFWQYLTVVTQPTMVLPTAGAPQKTCAMAQTSSTIQMLPLPFY